MEKEYEMEIMREIWNNEIREAEHFEIGPDRDGLGCVEIRMKNNEGKIIERMSFPPALATLIAGALIDCAGEMTQK